MSPNNDNDTTKAKPADEESPSLTTAQVCERLSQTFQNVERSLRCPISQSCFRSATMLSVCCHTFSGSSLRRLQPLQSCPVCTQKCSKRSLVTVPQLDRLVRAYKVCGTAFGLMPATHDPSLVMTQLPASQQQSTQPHSLADAQEQLWAARTFAKYCHAQGYREERHAVVLNMERTMVAVQKQPPSAAVPDAFGTAPSSRLDHPPGPDTTRPVTRDDDDHRAIPAVTNPSIPDDSSPPGAKQKGTEDGPASSVVQTRTEHGANQPASTTKDLPIETDRGVQSQASSAAGMDPAEGGPSVALAVAPTTVCTPTFAVGDVVQVQSRTWPGVNLPGGVGRIKTVYRERENVRYDIDYVLGGRERKVDAVFCAPTDLPKLGRRKSAAQRQPVASQRLERKQQDNDFLPPDLWAQLKSEGFDVGGERRGAHVSTGKRVRGRSSASATRQSSIPHKDVSQSTAALANRKRKAPPRNETTTQTTCHKKARTGRSILARVTNLGRKPTSAAVAPLPVPRSDADACALADTAYQTRYDKALSRATLSLATSGLSEAELDRVHLLCRTVKDVRIRVSTTISKQTTLCIMAADPKTPTMAKVRTAKSMRAALLGIPLVPPTWIDQCVSSGKLVPPVSFVRALPSKSSKGSSPCGVAHLAASSQRLLQNYHVYLCLPSRLQQDVTQLVQDAGGTVTSRLAAPNQDQPLVLLCGDSDQGMSTLVQKTVKKHPKDFVLVYSHWLFDSVSHGGLLSVSSYKPPGPKALALCTLQEKAFE